MEYAQNTRWKVFFKESQIEWWKKKDSKQYDKYRLSMQWISSDFLMNFFLLIELFIGKYDGSMNT